MVRSLYLATLPVLQLALVVKFAPPLAQALRANAIPALAPDGWPAMLQFVATSLAVAGAALALAFPGLAAARHHRAGAHRFTGLPGWAVALALTGTSLLVAATLALVVAPILEGESQVIAELPAHAGLAGGLAMATAGVLCAELLRRSVAVVRAVPPGARPATGRIEVTYPPELRTHGAAERRESSGRKTGMSLPPGRPEEGDVPPGGTARSAREPSCLPPGRPRKGRPGSPRGRTQLLDRRRIEGPRRRRRGRRLHAGQPRQGGAAGAHARG